MPSRPSTKSFCISSISLLYLLQSILYLNYIVSWLLDIHSSELEIEDETKNGPFLHVFFPLIKLMILLIFAFLHLSCHVSTSDGNLFSF